MTKPEFMVMAPIYAPMLAELERDFTVHKLWTARDPDAFMQEVSGRVRGVVTTGLLGFSRSRFDVFWDEPRVPAELLAMEPVVLVPHIGSSTREIREERGIKLLANLRAHFTGKPVVNPLA